MYWQLSAAATQAASQRHHGERQLYNILAAWTVYILWTYVSFHFSSASFAIKFSQVTA